MVDVLTTRMNEPARLQPWPSGTAVLAGRPEATFLLLDRLGSTEIGIWEMTPGVTADVEMDEVLVITAGRGTLHVSGTEIVSLRPGAIIRLHAGEQSVWTIQETVRAVSIEVVEGSA